MWNREEKWLRHVAMVANFWMTTNRKHHLKSEFALFQTSTVISFKFHLICQMLAKFSGVKSEKTVSKFRKRKRQFLRCARLLRKAGAWNREVSRRSRATTAKRRTKQRDARAQLLFCWYKPMAFFHFSLPSLASLLKLPIQKFCYHGNVTSHLYCTHFRHPINERSRKSDICRSKSRLSIQHSNIQHSTAQRGVI